MNKNILVEKATILVNLTIKYTWIWKKVNKEYELASQCFRSVTSVQANIEEANAAEGRRDFAHKLCISRKELRETIYWVKLAKQCSLLGEDDLNEILAITTEVYKLLNASIKTSRKNSGYKSRISINY